MRKSLLTSDSLDPPPFSPPPPFFPPLPCSSFRDVHLGTPLSPRFLYRRACKTEDFSGSQYFPFILFFCIVAGCLLRDLAFSVFPVPLSRVFCAFPAKRIGPPYFSILPFNIELRHLSGPVSIDFVLSPPPLFFCTEPTLILLRCVPPSPISFTQKIKRGGVVVVIRFLR